MERMETRGSVTPKSQTGQSTIVKTVKSAANFLTGTPITGVPSTFKAPQAPNHGQLISKEDAGQPIDNVSSINDSAFTNKAGSDDLGGPSEFKTTITMGDIRGTVVQEVAPNKLETVPKKVTFKIDEPIDLNTSGITHEHLSEDDDGAHVLEDSIPECTSDDMKETSSFVSSLKPESFEFDDDVNELLGIEPVEECEKHIIEVSKDASQMELDMYQRQLIDHYNQGTNLSSGHDGFIPVVNRKRNKKKSRRNNPTSNRPKTPSTPSSICSTFSSMLPGAASYAQAVTQSSSSDSMPSSNNTSPKSDSSGDTASFAGTNKGDKEEQAHPIDSKTTDSPRDSNIKTLTGDPSLQNTKKEGSDPDFR